MNTNPNFNSTKISKETLKKLRIIAALTAEKQYEVLDRLIDKEYERVQKQA